MQRVLGAGISPVPVVARIGSIASMAIVGERINNIIAQDAEPISPFTNHPTTLARRRLESVMGS